MRSPIWTLILLVACGSSPAPDLDVGDELTADTGADLTADAAIGDSTMMDVPDVPGDVTSMTDIQADLAQEVSVSCDDGNLCTDDELGPKGCSHIPNAAPCTWHCGALPGGCQKGICLALSGGAGAGCDDGNPCTNDLCNMLTCQHYTIPKGVVIKCTNAAGQPSVCDTKGKCL